MTSFVAGQIADASITTIALGVGFPERGVGMSRLLETGGITDALLVKMAVTVIITGLYAISKELGSRHFWSIDKGTRIGNLVTWGAVALNTLRLAGYFS